MNPEHQQRVSSSDVEAFVQRAKSAGVADETLVALLRQNGWPARHVYRSLFAYYAQSLGMAPPLRSSQGENARDAFLYLLNFITLGYWTTALGWLAYVLIQRRFPDAAATSNGYYYGGETLMAEIAFQIASILVTLPLFLYLDRHLEREMKRRTDLRESGVRLWLTYIALGIAAMVVIADAIGFVDSLLRGELTIRFLLDTLVLLILGGGIFIYYFSALRRDAER